MAAHWQAEVTSFNVPAMQSWSGAAFFRKSKNVPRGEEVGGLSGRSDTTVTQETGLETVTSGLPQSDSDPKQVTECSWCFSKTKFNYSNVSHVCRDMTHGVQAFAWEAGLQDEV